MSSIAALRLPVFAAMPWAPESCSNRSTNSPPARAARASTCRFAAKIASVTESNSASLMHSSSTAASHNQAKVTPSVTTRA